MTAPPPPPPPMRPITDGIVRLRPPVTEDVGRLVAGRDEESRRWLGAGSPHPWPTAVITVDGTLAGWVDHDRDQAWLAPDEVNVGYGLFPEHRGRGLASRAVPLLLHHLATTSPWRVATLLIDRRNGRSLAVAERCRFEVVEDRGPNRLFRRPVPPTTYTDGVITIRPQRADDIDADLEAKDDEQIDRLWLPGQRESWQAMSPAQQRAHALAGLEANAAAFGAGPKWTFAADTGAATYVAYVDVDLANPHVPAGEANISYAAHPAHRGRGHVSRAVRLVLRFLREHTGAPRAHILVDPANVASLRVAAAVGARRTDADAFDDHGRRLIRHVLDLRVL